MKTRETNKKTYISKFIEIFKNELAGTIWTEEGQEIWMETHAICEWERRKKDVENKADALMYGLIDAKKYCIKIREASKLP